MNIAACIITFNPDLDTFRKVVESISNQVKSIMVIDNCSDNFYEILPICNRYSNVIFNQLNHNMGVAYATNIALKHFLQAGYDFVLTCDQDSIFNSNYISEFLEIAEDNKNNLPDIAAFVPNYFDTVKNETCEIYIKTKHGSKKTFFKEGEKYISVFHAIASGMLINLSQISEIGLMNEKLFIDMVDIEWTMRAGSKNKKIICCRKLQMTHHLGDRSVKFLGKTFTSRTPIRSYYIVRNGIYVLLHSNYLSKYYIVSSIIKKIVLIFVFTFISNEHVKTFKYSIKGAYDGFFGKL